MSSFTEIGPLVKKLFVKGFYHIWTWRPSWSCDPEASNKLVRSSHGGSTQNLALICHTVSEKRKF